MRSTSQPREAPQHLAAGLTDLCWGIQAGRALKDLSVARPFLSTTRTRSTEESARLACQDDVPGSTRAGLQASWELLALGHACISSLAGLVLQHSSKDTTSRGRLHIPQLKALAFYPPKIPVSLANTLHGVQASSRI